MTSMASLKGPPRSPGCTFQKQRVRGYGCRSLTETISGASKQCGTACVDSTSQCSSHQHHASDMPTNSGPSSAEPQTLTSLKAMQTCSECQRLTSVIRVLEAEVARLRAKVINIWGES